MKIPSLGQSTIYMTLASVAQKLISFVYFAIVARSLGAEDTGKYFFALSFTTIFVVFVDFGLTNVLVREVAKAKHRLYDLVSSTLGIKLVFGVATYVGMIVLVYLLEYDLDVRLLVIVAGITMLLDSLHTTLYGSLRALSTIRYEAYAIIATQFATLVLGTTFLYFQFPLYFLMLAFLIPSLANAWFSHRVLRVVYHVRIRPQFRGSVVRYMLPIAVPFALSSIFARVFAYTDSILLSQFIGNTAVGWYSVPYKIAFAFQFIPFALIAGLYPRMSEHIVNHPEKVSEMFFQSIRYLLAISIPLSVGIILLAPEIVNTFFGVEYTESVLPLQVLMLGMVASFVNVVLGTFLNASNRQMTQTVFLGMVMVFNIVLNILLIPLFGVVGAAITATSSNVLLGILSWIKTHYAMYIPYHKFGQVLLRIGVACTTMGLVVWYTKPYVHVIGASVVGILVFCIIFVLLRGVTSRDIAYIRSLRIKP